MELPLQTILSITTGFLHCSYTDLAFARSVESQERVIFQLAW